VGPGAHVGDDLTCEERQSDHGNGCFRARGRSHRGATGHEWLETGPGASKKALAIVVGEGGEAGLPAPKVGRLEEMRQESHMRRPTRRRARGGTWLAYGWRRRQLLTGPT